MRTPKIQLPSFQSIRVRRNQQKHASEKPHTGSPLESDNVEPAAAGGGGVLENTSDRTLTPTHTMTGVDIKRATRARRNAIWLSMGLFFIAGIFLILTLIGNTYNKPVLNNTYFFTINLANIILEAAPDAVLVNSIARSIGLHDFYQVGLWGFCEGYNDEGVTYCSRPAALYWFNPVEILLNELFAGATITLPADINTILSLIRLASHLMFGFFLTGTILNFLSIPLCILSLYSRWYSFSLSIFTFITALLTAAAAIIATVMFTIFKNVITSQAGLSIEAGLGTQMLAFMWIGAAASVLAWCVQVGLCCCCASRRDVRTGRRKGSKKAWRDGAIDEREEKKEGEGTRKRAFWKRREGEQTDVVD